MAMRKQEEFGGSLKGTENKKNWKLILWASVTVAKSLGDYIFNRGPELVPLDTMLRCKRLKDSPPRTCTQFTSHMKARKGTAYNSSLPCLKASGQAELGQKMAQVQDLNSIAANPHSTWLKLVISFPCFHVL